MALDDFAICACPGAIIAGLGGFVLIDVFVGQCKLRVHEKCPACLFPRGLDSRCTECGESLVLAEGQNAEVFSRAEFFREFLLGFGAGMLVCVLTGEIVISMLLNRPMPGSAKWWIAVASSPLSLKLGPSFYAMLGAVPVLFAAQRARMKLVHVRYSKRVRHVGMIVSFAAIAGAGLSVAMTLMFTGPTVWYGSDVWFVLIPGTVLMCSSVLGALSMAWVAAK